jgi:N6-L-threonylcarbamoyladenine synthase
MIYVHHMQAHATTALLNDPAIEWPYLCLLASGVLLNIVHEFRLLLFAGGHCLLCIAHSPTDYTLLGTTTDIAPGECVDKAARRMRLHAHFDEFRGLSRIVQTTCKCVCRSERRSRN